MIARRLCPRKTACSLASQRAEYMPWSSGPRCEIACSIDASVSSEWDLAGRAIHPAIPHMLEPRLDLRRVHDAVPAPAPAQQPAGAVRQRASQRAPVPVIEEMHLV